MPSLPAERGTTLALQIEQFHPESLAEILLCCVLTPEKPDGTFSRDNLEG